MLSGQSRDYQVTHLRTDGVHQPKVALSLKTLMVKAEAIGALRYVCSAWTLRQEHYAKLSTVHHRVLLRIIGTQRKRPDYQMTSHNRALKITRCESIEATLRTRRLLWAGTLIGMSGGRVPKRIVFGNLEGAVRRGRGGKAKEGTDCVQSDSWAFGIAGDGKVTALKAEMWAKTVAEGGRRFMAAWRKEEIDAARHRQEERGNETGKVVIAHGSVEFCEVIPIGLADESKESLYGRETDRDLRRA